MKKTLLLAGFSFALYACNEQSTEEGKPKSSDHTGHHSPAADKSAGQANEVHATMENMMREMHSAKPTGNNGVDFATMMMAHHRGAVAMAEVEVARGRNAELKSFAQKVIDDQQKEIAFMQAFVEKSPNAASPRSAEFQKALNNSMAAMMDAKTKNYNDVDKDFAAQMIPHHQSAVDMAKAYLKVGEDESLRTLCENIVRSQSQEINWLNEWLKKHAS